MTSDQMISVAIASVFVTGAVVTYHIVFTRRVLSAIQIRALQAMRNGLTPRQASRGVDFGEIRFIALCSAISWPFFWSIYGVRTYFTRRDHERREQLARVAQMLIEERKGTRGRNV